MLKTTLVFSMAAKVETVLSVCDRFEVGEAEEGQVLKACPKRKGTQGNQVALKSRHGIQACC
jgi:hypothetical protein